MPDGQNNGNSQDIATVTLQIAFNQVTGAVSVTGPIQNTLLCYGLMELARDVVKKYAEANQSRIAIPQGFKVSTREIS